MKTTPQLLLIVVILICCSRAGIAQSLNDIKIGHCTSNTVLNNATAAGEINAASKLTKTWPGDGCTAFRH